MSDEIQPGTKVDADLWQEFREEVERRHGVVRGNLKSELEAQLRAYVNGTETATSDLEARLARIEAKVGVGATDGGAQPSEPAEDTHTPTDLPEVKPHPNSGRKKKIAYLAAEYRRQHGQDNLTLRRALPHTIRQVIEDEYGFADEERTEKYVEDILEYLDMVPHPEYDHKYIPEDRRDEILEEQREQTREDAQERSEKL